MLRFLDHTQLGTHIQQDFFDGVICLSQRLLPTQRTANTRDKHPCRQRSQQSSSFRPTVQTALPPVSAFRHLSLHRISAAFHLREYRYSSCGSIRYIRPKVMKSNSRNIYLRRSQVVIQIRWLFTCTFFSCLRENKEGRLCA